MININQYITDKDKGKDIVDSSVVIMLEELFFYKLSFKSFGLFFVKLLFVLPLFIVFAILTAIGAQVKFVDGGLCFFFEE
jgi:hypothetical protein|tara:strand:+ start:1938 stop:2177 length:240 start_codon:yes stop_codon:yes gene_type:complete